MKAQLLPTDLPTFKADLHTHTILSDGKKTPEQVKADHPVHGCSVISFTDHDNTMTPAT